MKIQKGGKADAEARAYVDKLWKRFDVKQTPTIFVMNSEGWVYGRTGYKDGTDEKSFAAELAGWAKQRKPAIADLTAKLGAAPGDADIVGQLTARASMWGLMTGDYLDQKLKLAETTAGAAKAQHLADLARYYSDQREQDKYSKYLKQARASSPAVAKELEIILALQAELAPLFEKRQWGAVQAKLVPYAATKGNILQEAQYQTAYLEYCQEHWEKARELYEKARATAPNALRGLQAAGAIEYIDWKLKQ